MNAPNNSIFENNLHLLSRKDNSLAKTLKDAPLSSSLLIIPAKSGLFTVEAKIALDCTRLVHSAVNPLEEARRWAQVQNISANVFVLMGMGLGYPALALLDQGFTGKLLVIEQDTGIFKLAATYCDLTDILINENVSIFAGENADDFVSNVLKEKTDILGYGIYHPAVSLHPEFYERIRLHLDKIIFERHKLHHLQTCLVLENALKEMMI
jgi:hypothetical protein